VQSRRSLTKLKVPTVMNYCLLTGWFIKD